MPKRKKPQNAFTPNSDLHKITFSSQDTGNSAQFSASSSGRAQSTAIASAPNLIVVPARYPGHPTSDQGELPSHHGHDTIIPEAAFDHRRYGHAPDRASDPAASASSRPDQGTSSNLAAPDEALNVARSGCTPMNTITITHRHRGKHTMVYIAETPTMSAHGVACRCGR